MGRLAGGGGGLVHLGGQAEHQEVAAARLQVADRLPGADHQQGVAQLQLLFQQAALQRLAVAPQADHVEVVLAAELQLAHALAEQGGFRRQGHFGHAHVMGLVGELLAVQAQRLQASLEIELRMVDGRIE
ncbi:hypothetical protein D9M72_575250 [compost metagenome]